MNDLKKKSVEKKLTTQNKKTEKLKQRIHSKLKTEQHETHHELG